jgi:hypothetical protein
MTKKEVCDKDEYLQKNTFDYALPQEWVDDFYNLMKVYPTSYFVWIYDEYSPLFGRPYPITDEGKRLLEQYYTFSNAKEN